VTPKRNIVVFVRHIATGSPVWKKPLASTPHSRIIVAFYFRDSSRVLEATPSSDPRTCAYR